MRVGGLILLFSLGCGRVGFGVVDASADGLDGIPDTALDTADDALDAVVDGPADGALGARDDASFPTGPFSVPAIVAPLDGGSGGIEGNPTATDDVLEMYFNRLAGTVSQIYRSTRPSRDDPWGDPVLDAELSAPGNVWDPEVRGDGLLMLVRVEPGADSEIYQSTRASRDDPWSVPVRVDALSSPSDDGSAAPGPGGLLVMSSDRASSMDLYMSTDLGGGTWSSPTSIVELNTDANDDSPFLFDVGRRLIFESNRDGSEDLWTAARLDLDSPFVVIGTVTELASSADDSDPWISPDGRYVLLSSNRDGAYRIYEAFR